MQSFILRQTSLPRHVVQFSRYLREQGFSITSSEETDLLQALKNNISQSFDEHKFLHKAILVKKRQEFLQFDALYDSYWLELSRGEDAKKQDYQEKANKKKKSKGKDLQALKQWLYSGHIDEEKELASYSSFEAVTQQDFNSFLDTEYKDVQEVLRLLSKRLVNKESRRFVRSKKKKVLDVKNTIKASLKNGLEIRDFVFKKQKKKKLKLVLICDVSKSMELYSKFLIQFIYGFQQTVYKLNTFIFSTKLVPVSRILKDEDYAKVLAKLSEYVEHWSGGTRIGESLYQFKERYSNSLIDQDAIIIIVSDGWDTGETEDLESTMRLLHKRSNRIIWINPLAGNPAYRPSTKAMQIALPYIDVFTSAHNIDSLRRVVSHLHLKKHKPFSL